MGEKERKLGLRLRKRWALPSPIQWCAFSRSLSLSRAQRQSHTLSECDNIGQLLPRLSSCIPFDRCGPGKRKQKQVANGLEFTLILKDFWAGKKGSLLPLHWALFKFGGLVSLLWW